VELNRLGLCWEAAEPTQYGSEISKLEGPGNLESGRVQIAVFRGTEIAGICNQGWAASHVVGVLGAITQSGHSVRGEHSQRVARLISQKAIDAPAAQNQRTYPIRRIPEFLPWAKRQFIGPREPEDERHSGRVWGNHRAPVQRILSGVVPVDIDSAVSVCERLQPREIAHQHQTVGKPAGAL